MNREAIEYFKSLKQDEYAFTARDKEMFDVAIQALSYDDAKYHEEHGEVVVAKEVWEDALQALKQRLMVEDIRAEIQYEADNKALDKYMMAYYRCLQIIDRNMKGVSE